MNEHDAFEQELAALKPLPPSSTLKSKIAGQLDQRPETSRIQDKYAARLVWRLSLALGIALAVIGVVRTRRHAPTASLQPATSSAIDAAIALNPALPTLWNYRHADLDSQAGLDALLDRYSAAGARSAPARTFSVLTSTKDSSLGDL